MGALLEIEMGRPRKPREEIALEKIEREADDSSPYSIGLFAAIEAQAAAHAAHDAYLQAQASVQTTLDAYIRAQAWADKLFADAKVVGKRKKKRSK